MLARLRVKNLALVENISIDLDRGLNIITGETGAGKSILIGALNLLLGERADKSIIRTGEDACGSEALFELEDSSEVDAVLEDYGIPPCEDGQLVVRRIVKASGSGQNLINDSPVTLQVMKRLGDIMVDMHGPHEHQSLLSQDYQLAVLDEFGHLYKFLKEYQAEYRSLQSLRERRSELELDEETIADQIDRLSHTVKEIEDADIKQGEDEEVAQEHQQAGNAHRILELAGNISRALSEDEDSVFDKLTGMHSALDELQGILPIAADWRDQIEEITSQIQEIARDVSSQIDESSVNPARLSWLDQRLETFQRLKRKYGSTLDDVSGKLEESRTKLDDLRSRDERIRELDQEIEQQREIMLEKADELRRQRQKAAVKLADCITKELKGLGFEQGEFALEMHERDPSPSGIDEVDFGFAPNIGEVMRPLRSIASSGEISRVMLACKVVLARHDKIPILIFDEIDANLGGEMGHPVGMKLAEAATDHQVICITHLPQVAVCGDQHFAVSKYVRDERTFTAIEKIAGDRRVAEIARMLGDESSRTARDHACEMLDARA